MFDKINVNFVGVNCHENWNSCNADVCNAFVGDGGDA